MADAPDTAAVANATDHEYVAPENEPWGRCVKCGLAQASHRFPGMAYKPDADYREEPEPDA